MSMIHPPQHPVPVFVFTPAGWIHGVIHVPTVKNLLTHLNGQEDLLKLTDVVLPGTKHAQPFLALHRSAALLVIPQEAQGANKGESDVAARGRRLVTCLFSLGSIRGQLDVPGAVRTSDYLLRSPGFIELYQCHMGPSPYLDPAEITGEPFPLILVNTKSLVGTTEETADSE